MDRGWIKLHRQLQDCCIWQKNEPFDSRSAWIDLLLSATHKQKKIIIDDQVVTIERGSFMTSILKLSAKWGWSRGKVNRYIQLLESEQMVSTKRTPKGTLITIVKYEFFQCKELENDTTLSTTVGTALDTTGDTADKQKENEANSIGQKEKKHKVAAKFIPPTVSEVQTYCIERQNGIDAQSFIDFYESKGWMIGKNKMKDWRAAVRTWERGRKSVRKDNIERDILGEWRGA